MSLSVSCLHCGRVLQAREEWVGKTVRCPCGQPITVSDDGGVVNLLKEELNINIDPIVCASPEEWAKLTGASPEVTAQLRKKLKPRASGNANFMMGVAGVIAAVMLVIGLAAFLLGR